MLLPWDLLIKGDPGYEKQKNKYCQGSNSKRLIV